MDHDELAAAFQEGRGRQRDRQLAAWLATLPLDDLFFLIGQAATQAGRTLNLTEAQVLQRAATLVLMEEMQHGN